MSDGKDDKAAAGKIVSNLMITTILVMVVLSVLIFIGFTHVAIIVAAGMMPGIVASILDSRPGKYASKTVLMFNLSGMLPQFASIIMSSAPNTTAQGMLTNPYTWLWVYMFAAFGWVLVHFIPQIVFLYLSLRAEYTVKKLHGFQDTLLNEWGEEIKG